MKDLMGVGAHASLTPAAIFPGPVDQPSHPSVEPLHSGGFHSGASLAALKRIEGGGYHSHTVIPSETTTLFERPAVHLRPSIPEHVGNNIKTGDASGVTKLVITSGMYNPAWEEQLRDLNVALIVINEPSDEEVAALSQQGFLHVPNKIAWFRNRVSWDEFLRTQSKNSRKTFLRELAASQGLHVAISPLTEERFTEWREVYVRAMSEHQRGFIRVDPDWVQKRGKEIADKHGGIDKNYAIVSFRDPDTSLLLGGNIMRVRRDRSRLIRAYGALPSAHRNQHLSLRVFFEQTNHAQEVGLAELGYGVDSYFYGHHTDTGVLQYKLKLGFSPSLNDESVKPQLVKILDWSKLMDDVFIFTYSDETRTGLTAHYFPGSADADSNRFKLPDGITLALHERPR